MGPPRESELASRPATAAWPSSTLRRTPSPPAPPRRGAGARARHVGMAEQHVAAYAVPAGDPQTVRRRAQGEDLELGARWATDGQGVDGLAVGRRTEAGLTHDVNVNIRPGRDAPVRRS